MSEERRIQPNKPPTEISQAKQLAWEKRRQEVEKITDVIGQPIDAKVKDTIIALNLLEFPTVQSCQGHLDYGYAAPWVMIQAQDEPEEMRVGQKATLQKVADKYGIEPKDIENYENRKAFNEYWSLLDQDDPTPEYEKWREENHRLYARMERLIKEYLQKRSLNTSNIQLKKIFAGDVVLLHTGGGDYGKAYWGEDSETKPDDLPDRLKKYQAEMADFTEFLKEKFYKGELL